MHLRLFIGAQIHTVLRPLSNDISHAYFSYNFFWVHSARCPNPNGTPLLEFTPNPHPSPNPATRSRTKSFLVELAFCFLSERTSKMPAFHSIFSAVTALGLWRSVRGHSFVHEYIQFDVLFQTICNMPTFPTTFYEVTALGQRRSVISMCDLAYAKRLDLLKKMSYHSAKSVDWFRRSSGRNTQTNTNRWTIL